MPDDSRPLMAGGQHGRHASARSAAGDAGYAGALAPLRPGSDPAYCFPAIDEAGQYERECLWHGGTAWEAARALAPGAIFLPDCTRYAILRNAGKPGPGGFPLGWDAGMIAGAVLAVARDPDRITWDDPAAWPGMDTAGQPCWRAEGTAGAVTITVAVSADGEITGARPDPAARCRMQPPAPARSHEPALHGRKDTGMTADGTAGPGHGQAGYHDSASEPGPGNPARLPAMIAHLMAVCRARQARGWSTDVQVPDPSRYVVTVRRGGRELSLTFARRRRRWDLADIRLTEDGKPLNAARSLYEVIRMLSDHEIGTDTPSPVRGTRQPRDSALEAKKNTVLRV